LTALLTLQACALDGPRTQVQAKYDEQTGKLSQLTINAGSDGNPNIVSHMDGTKFVRIEIDTNEDGKTDRWEYYDSGQRVNRVAVSRSDDGKPDTWLFQAADGSLARIEMSTQRDGVVNRTEFFEKGILARAQEDTDADGRIDKWEEYHNGALASVSFDLTKSGKPTTTINYPK
jgi:hypothetical protein